MRTWILSGVAVLIAGAVGFFALRDQWAPLGPGRVKPVPADDQEIAWIAPATAGESWERLVKAVRLLESQWPDVHGGEPLVADTQRAFLPLTADVPEIGIRFPHSGTLWIRWYKLSGVNDASHWLAALQRRATSPIAIVGGDTSDRALRQGRLLERIKSGWTGSPPIFLITTATAERYLPEERADIANEPESWPRLIDVYPGRSFRFSFTNTRMVEAVLDFVKSRRSLWPDRDIAAPPIDLTAPFSLITIAWGDDSYSTDLAESFRNLYSQWLREKFGPDTPLPCYNEVIPYSVGDYYQPNPREEIAVDLFLVNRPAEGDLRELIVLPTSAQRARRFLRTLCRRAPGEVKNIVVASGDSISFNQLYRDRDLAWNIQDVPVPLIVFSHRNPIDPSAGFNVKAPGADRPDITGTQDLLLYRDLIEAAVLAAFRDGQLLEDTDQVLARLRKVRWRSTHVAPSLGDDDAGVPFFDAEGNRTPGTGEHIVWLNPVYEKARIRPQGTLSVYRQEQDRPRSSWQRVGPPLVVSYGHSPGGAP